MPSLFRTDLRLRARYSQGGGIYRILPAAVARPVTLDELRAVLEQAERSGLAVTPRGAGSAMDGGNLGEGLVLDLTELGNRTCVVDPLHLTARCAPSATLPALHAVTHPHGLHLPLDPSSAPWATFGGMIGTNAAGARTVRDGPMREWVAGLTLETSDGPLTLERGVAPDAGHPVVKRWGRDAVPLLTQHRTAVMARWPQTRKNTLGYDLAAWWRSGDLLDLVIGSEGTLGVISDVTVRLAPVAAAHVTLRVALASRADLVPALECIRRFDPAVLEFLDASFLRVVDAPLAPDTAAVLLANFEGAVGAEVSARAERCREALLALPAGVLEVELSGDPAGIAELWRIRHGASSRLAALTDGRQSVQVIEDGCVPPARLGDYLAAVQGICDAEAIDVVMFGHAGDGHVHVNFLPNLRDDDWLARVQRIYDATAEALLALGGTPAGEHGAGRLRAPLIAAFLGPEAVECFQAIKAAFDPAGRWNPGVILNRPGNPLRQLKIGSNAEPLPADIVESLREIERTAAWGASRWIA